MTHGAQQPEYTQNECGLRLLRNAAIDPEN
jgi:hypothetical protein